MRDGRGFMFVSSRAGGCGALDIYVTRWHETRGWRQPVNPGCGVNSSGDEASPFLVGDELFFSSTRSGDSDIYVAAVDDEGSIGTPSGVAALNTASTDARPNVRRDGLEIFFDSNRSGGCGGLDLWTATRVNVGTSWSAPANVGCTVNSAANDLRASLSWDATHLYFGSNRVGSEGNQDVYVATRERVPAV
jgi:Tol biopolymer transport system component